MGLKTCAGNRVTLSEIRSSIVAVQTSLVSNLCAFAPLCESFRNPEKGHGRWNFFHPRVGFLLRTAHIKVKAAFSPLLF